ncbi:MAG: hypothetical protein ISR65_02880 [Bacteriovoracaceae bacterium]|nr:hypothetical protein [Bacteriovoracaceae bacterium]
MTNLLRETLLIEVPVIAIAAKELSKYALYLVTPIFIWSIITDFLTDMQFFDTTKRMIFSLLMLSFYLQFHVAAVNSSFDLAEEFLSSPRYSKNIFMKLSRLENKHKRVNGKKNGGWFSKIERWVIKEAKFLQNDFVSGILWAIVRLCLLFLRFIYSGVYHFSYAFVGIISLIHIFSFGKKAVGAAMRSTIWCILMPWIVSVSLIFLGAIYDGFNRSSGKSIDELLLMVAIGVFLLFTPVISQKIIDGSGIASMGEALGKMGTQALLFGGTTVFAGKLASAGGWGGKKLKDGLSHTGSAIKDEFPSTAETIARQGLFSNPFKGSTNLAQTAALGLDAVANPIKNRNINKQKQMVGNLLTNKGLGDLTLGHSEFLQNYNPSKSNSENAQNMYLKKLRESNDMQNGSDDSSHRGMSEQQWYDARSYVHDINNGVKDVSQTNKTTAKNALKICGHGEDQLWINDPKKYSKLKKIVKSKSDFPEFEQDHKEQ